MSKSASQSTDAPSQMLTLLNACLTTQALHVAASLGVADLMGDGPVGVSQLASATGAHAPSLYRLLRMLVGVGVFQESERERFTLTPLGQALRTDGPDSVRDWALYVGALKPWEAWGRLRETVMTGKPGFVLAHGMPTYQYLARHPELGAPFDRWMSKQSDQHNAAIVAAYDFGAFRKIADVGGGQGSTLAAILHANSSLRGVLFDQPQVVAHPVALEANKLIDRCEVIGGDMLEGVPGGADVYLIKRVLMIWGDEQAIQVLKHCRSALLEGGKVLAVEMVMPQDNNPGPARNFDLLMMLAHEGKMRTETEFRNLFHAAGLRLDRIIITASPNSILEGTAI